MKKINAETCPIFNKLRWNLARSFIGVRQTVRDHLFQCADWVSAKLWSSVMNSGGPWLGYTGAAVDVKGKDGEKHKLHNALNHGWLARWRKWRACDVGEAKEGDGECALTYVTRAHSPNFASLHLQHSSFSNPSAALTTSQLIFQPFRCFTYVTVHSQTLLSFLLRHKLFT